MSGTTITGFYNATVYLGIGGVPSPLVVTGTGLIIPVTYGGAGVYASATAGAVSIENDGTIFGAYGGSGFVGTPTYGGTGIELLSSGVVTNDGVIRGGGGGGGAYYLGMNAGNGINLAGGGSIYNYGTISGGTGGYSGEGYGGNGGTGIDIGNAGYLRNFGVITGGAGGMGVNGDTGAEYGGDGGAGVILSAGGFIENYGKITGGVGGFLISASGVGVELTAGGTLENDGTVTGGGLAPNHGYNGQAGANGVDLHAGGSVYNAFDSVIIGGGGGYNFIGTTGGAGGSGIYLKAGGSVANYGTIIGGTGGDAHSARANSAGVGGIGVDLAAGGTLVNHGAITGGYGGNSYYNYGDGGNGVQVTGGLVTNYGTITGGTGGVSYWGGFGGNGVELDGGTLVNDGTINGGTPGFSQYLQTTGFNAGDAVHFGSGAGTLVVDPGAVFNGYVAANASFFDVLKLAGTTPGTISGLGSEYTGFRIVNVNAGADWTLAGSNSIASNATITVRGSLAVTGSLTGRVEGWQHALLANSGTISGGVYGSHGATTVTNTGTISSATFGVNFSAGGTITNAAGASIGGTQGGIDVVGNAGVTVVNSGIIAGAGGSRAIQFGGGNDRLVVHQGAAFTGAVDGGAGTNTLELAATTGSGSISGLGSSFTGFTTVQVDAGGEWTLGGTDILLAGSSIKDAGTLIVTGTLDDAGTATISTGGNLQVIGTGLAQINAVTLSGGNLEGAGTAQILVGGSASGGHAGTITVESGAKLSGFGTLGGATVVDTGTIAAQNGVLNLANAVNGTGTITIGNGATLSAASTLGVASVVFGSGPNSLVLAAPHAVTSVMSGFRAGDVIDIKNIVATTLSFLGGTLTLDNGAQVVDTIDFKGSYKTANFALSSDGHGGTDISYKGAMEFQPDISPGAAEPAWVAHPLVDSFDIVGIVGHIPMAW